ncbi:MAG: hypothetical protein WCA10_16070 [Terracidiphilus sp.]
MRPDRPLILSVLLMAAGLGLTFFYCTGNVGLNAAYPLSGAALKINLATYGPAALGGPALTALGLVLLLWSWICAIFRQMGLFGTPADRGEEGPTRLFGPSTDHGEEPSRQLQ